MARSWKKVAIWACAVLVLLLAPAGSAQTPAKDPGIQKLVDAYIQAWAKGDAKAIGAMHTQNAIRVGVDGAVFSGRAAIEQSFIKGFASTLKGSTLTITRGTETSLTPDISVGSGTWAVAGGAPQPGSPTKGTYVNTLVRQGGQWLIASSGVIGVQ